MLRTLAMRSAMRGDPVSRTDDRLRHTRKGKVTFGVPPEEAIPGVLIRGLRLNFQATGSFGVAASGKGCRVVRKTIQAAQPNRIVACCRSLDEVPVEATHGCKEMLIMKLLNRQDPAGTYAPLLYSARFDVFQATAETFSLVQSLTMSNAGRSVAYMLSQGQALPIFTLLTQSTEALSFLHDQGVFHCDLSSFNLTYDRWNDRFRLIDFGNSVFFRTGNLFSSAGALNRRLHLIKPSAVAALTDDSLVVELIDPRPIRDEVLLGDSELTTLYFRDPSVIMAKTFRARSIGRRYDVFSLGMVLIEAMGFVKPGLALNEGTEILRLVDVEDAKKRRFYEWAATLCRYNRLLRGGLSADELEFWKCIINDDARLTTSLAEMPDFTPDLDRADAIWGSAFTARLKRMIHPLPDFRLDLLHSPIPDTLAAKNPSPRIDLSQPSLPLQEAQTSGRTIVMNLFESKFRRRRALDKVDYPSMGNQRLVIGSVTFRVRLDSSKDVYVERLHVEPGFEDCAGRFVELSIQRCCHLFQPSLESRVEAICLTILTPNARETRTVVQAFGSRARRKDPHHYRVVNWRVFPRNGSPSTNASHHGSCKI